MSTTAAARMDRKGRPSLVVPLAVLSVAAVALISVFFAFSEGEDSPIAGMDGQPQQTEVNAGNVAVDDQVAPARNEATGDVTQSAPVAKPAQTQSDANAAQSSVGDAGTDGQVVPTPSGPEGRDNNALTTE